MDLEIVRSFAVALLIGAMVGIEREKRRLGTKEASIGGLRTFMVMAQVGALSAWIGRHLDLPWVFPATLLAASATVIVAQYANARQHPETVGMTTGLAAIEVCLLGALCTLGHADIAVVLGVLTAAVLAYKQPLHGLIDKLGWDDIFAGLRLLIASFIVLPLLPNHPVDPWDALNPYLLWLLVILISGLSLVGYVASRWLGPGRGAAVTGIVGGLVSSTAVTISFARQCRDRTRAVSVDVLVGGILLAWVVMCVRVLIEIAIVHPPLLGTTWLPFVAMGATSGAGALAFFWRGGSRRGKDEPARDVPLANPFRLRAAIQFALFFGAVLLAVRIAERYASPAGTYVVAGLAGVTDVDAVTLSMAEQARRTVDATVATTAIVIAALSNTAGKLVLAVLFGGTVLLARLGVATAAIFASGMAALYFI